MLAVLLVTAGANNSNNAAPASARYGTYVEAMVGAPRFVNPLLASSDTDVDLARLVYSGLTRVAADGSLAPDLASGWEISPDGRTYTFTLKSALKWQDGEALTSDDLLFTLELLRRPDFPGDPTLAAPWKNVEVGAPGKQLVTFRLPAPDASFLQFTTLGILPRHAWGAIKSSDLITSPLNQTPIGSGAWRYVSPSLAASEAAGGGDAEATTPVPSASPAVDGVILEPNPYLPAENGSISRLWFRPYPTFGAALSGFKMGEVYGLGHIPAERLAEVAAVPGVQLHRQGLARYSMLIFNVRSPLFDKAETRRAIGLAIDRDALVRSSLNGAAQPGVSPILPQSWAYDPLLKSKAAYDPAQARQLLDAAGWRVGQGGVRARDGVTMSVVLAANADVPANGAVARQLAGFLGVVGVDVKLALVSRETLLRDYLGPRAFHMALVGWEAQGADPDVWAYWYSSRANVTGGLNFSGWSNPEADRSLDTARSTTDQAARASSYKTFQQLFLQDAPATILYSPLYVYATRAPATGVALPAYDLLSPAARFDTMGGWSLRPSRVP